MRNRSNMTNPQARLDAGESAFFLRQLEDIDKQAYQRRYPALIARQVIPTFQSVADWAHVYTWREWDKNGTAKVIANAADDLPMADVTGKEFSQVIKMLGAAYGYDIREIKAAAAMNVPLDSLRAEACRYAVEQQIDATLATGDADNGLIGILNMDSTILPAANRVQTYTLGTKAAGGIAWGTLAAPIASGQEVANDIIGMASKIVELTKGVWSRVRLVLPIDKYNYAASTRLNAINDTTALEFALKSSFVESVTPWFRCTGAGAGATNRMAAFPGDPLVLGGIVPMEWSPQAPQLRNLKYVINTIATCGGVVNRYPVSCLYGDGL